MQQYNNTENKNNNGFGEDVDVSLVAPNLWIANNCFDDETFQWIQQITTNLENRFEVSRPDNRLALMPGPDFDQLQQLGVSLIPMLDKITGENLNFMVSKYWLDLPGFGCQVHSDSEEIAVTFQCYILGSGNHLGAEFLHVDPSIKVEMIPNSGYINLNSDLKLHQVLGGYGVRQSIAFQYNYNRQ